MNNAHKKITEANVFEKKDFLTLFIENQMFGIPILEVQDVLNAQKITKVPLAPKEVAGTLNLRGRIVTAIDVRKKLNLAKSENTSSMSVVVEHNNELFSLIIDKVGDVMSLENKDYDPSPVTLEEAWRDISDGIYRLSDKLLVILNISKLLE